MGRLNRAQMQKRNRARVLAAARAEFTARGFREAKIDAIAERAELTRGAVYSNFPGKRALYLTVLAEDAEHAGDDLDPEPGRTARMALGAFARAWVTRLPFAVDDISSMAPLGADLLPEVLADNRMRPPFTQLMKLDGLVLGLALERLSPLSPSRLVRVAEAALTTLHGAGVLSAAAPGFVDPFDIVATCEQLTNLAPDDRWSPPHLPYVAKARPIDSAWTPPPAVDVLRAAPARLDGDGVVAVLGMHRLGAVEEALRAAPADTAVSAVVVSDHAAELMPLARLVIADLRRCLRAAVAQAAWPRLQIVLDATGALAAAAGVSAVSDATESAVRITAGRVSAHADGHGACHAAASS